MDCVKKGGLNRYIIHQMLTRKLSSFKVLIFLVFSNLLDRIVSITERKLKNLIDFKSQCDDKLFTLDEAIS